MKPVPLVLAILSACALVLAMPSPASARTEFLARAETSADVIADNLSSYEGVYVHPKAGRLHGDDALDRLRGAVARSRLPVYITVLPRGEAPAEPAARDRLLREVAGKIGRSGTYVLLAGGSLRAYSTALKPATTARLVANARRTGGRDWLKVLTALARAAGSAKQETSASGPNPNGGKVIPATSDDKGSALGTWELVLIGLAVILGVAAGVLVVRRRRVRPHGVRPHGNAPGPGGIQAGGGPHDPPGLEPGSHGRRGAGHGPGGSGGDGTASRAAAPYGPDHPWAPPTRARPGDREP